ncbi:MAG: peptide deformylase [Patescibacteria group bacterium]
MWKPTKPPFASYKKTVFAKSAKVADIVYQIGEYDALRKPSQEVPLDNITSPDMQKKFAYLKKRLLLYRKRTGYGRGIAAVQVGIPERFVVTYTPEGLLLLINPVITKKSQSLLRYSEGCMSAGAIFAPVVRPAWIAFEYYNEKGGKQLWDTKDDTSIGRMLNRVFQHEIDHLEGIINIDKVQGHELFLDSDPEFYATSRFAPVK